MKKSFQYCLASVIVLTGVSFAYLNGIPTTSLIPGALYVDYTVPLVGALQAVPKVTNNVTTLKIRQVISSATRVGLGQTFTVSYVLENTSVANAVTSIDPQLDFLFPSTANSTSGAYFTVLRTAPVAAYTLNGGSTQTNTFQVTVKANRPTGNIIVDGFIGGLGSNDQIWSSAAINSGYWFTGAVTPSIIRELAATLNIASINIISPAGAIDRIVSTGQPFTVSFNVMNLGEASVIGINIAQIQLNGANTGIVYTPGTVINQALTAPIIPGNYIVTATIVDMGAPLDESTGVTPAIQNGFVTMSITVQAPALLDIVSMLIPTDTVQAFQLNSPPITIDVQVKNIGSANARITVTNSDLGFSLFSGTELLGTPPSTSILVTANQTVTVKYLVTRFGSGPGICTVNVSINALDLNSSFNIVTASVAVPEQATYNVTYDAKVFLGAVSINPAAVSTNGSFQVYVPIIGTGAGVSVSVVPAITDLLIVSAPGGYNLTCNVLSVIPAAFSISGNETVFITYNVQILPAAVSGQYTVNLNSGTPAATDNISSLSASPPSGASVTATLNYDTLAPTLIAATPNLDLIPTLTRPTDNFRLTLQFSETMNATTRPSMNFNAAVPTIGAVLNGSWDLATTTIFTSGPMSLVTINEGFITVSYVSGVTDVAGNPANASPNFLRFYVDATKPVGTIAINNGEPLTVTPTITITANLTDLPYPLANTNNMWMMIVTPGADVSTNPGITINQWIPYSQAVTLDVDTIGGYITKNIFMYFRDEAGNISDIVTAAVFLDTAFITLVSPSIGAIISNNITLTANTSTVVPSVSFWVSVNNVQTLLAVVTAQTNGLFSYNWPTVNVLYPTATSNVSFYAIRHGAIETTSNFATGIIIDNAAPAVTVNAPAQLAYVAGTITISVVATDNAQLLTVNRVEVLVTWPTGSIIVTSAVTDALAVAYTLPPVADFTTINIAALAYDSVGNTAWSTTVNVLKYDSSPALNILVPTPGIYVRQNFTISGNASSPLSINMVTITTTSMAVAVTQSIGVGQVNWQATVNSTLASGLSLPITVNAYTDTLPAFVATRAVTYIVDETTPNILINLINGMGAIGTINITGSVTDALSGVSAVAISVDAGTWIAVSPAAFIYQLGITQPTHTFTIAVSDNAWPIPNTYSITYTLTRDYTLLPHGGFASPVSGDYVNNTMNIIVTASASDGSAAQAVWVQFNDNAGLGYLSPWITANNIGGISWNVQWPLDGSQTPAWHGVTYNAAIRVQTAQMVAAVTAAPQAVFVQDVYGASAVFTDANEGKQVYSRPVSVNYITGSLGALVSASYLMVDGVLVPGIAQSMITNNVQWQVYFNVDLFTGSVHFINLRTIDRVGNIVDSPTIAVRTIPSTVITERLPTSGAIDGSNIMYNPIYATNQQIVRFANITTMNITAVKVDHASRAVSWNAFGELEVTIDALENVKVIALLEGDALTGIVTPHYQPISYDITPPTVNVIFNGVHRYYPTGYIAPNELFSINVLDQRSITDIYGNTLTVVGLSQSLTYNYIVTPASTVTASQVLRSLYAVGTTTSVLLMGDSYNPYTSVYSFSPAANLLADEYDLAMYVVDNAGNTLNVTFNVSGMVVDREATGEAGVIDTDLFYSAYPNPYDPDEGDMQITYYLKDNAKQTKIYIYNELGELLKIIAIDAAGEAGTRAGYNAVLWDGKDAFRKKIANGIYLFMVVVDGEQGQSHVKGKFIVLRR